MDRARRHSQAYKKKHGHVRHVLYLDLLRCPLVQVDRFHSGDVDAQVAVDASTADTHEHPEVP